MRRSEFLKLMGGARRWLPYRVHSRRAARERRAPFVFGGQRASGPFGPVRLVGKASA
jgi:hypothetical protein